MVCLCARSQLYTANVSKISIWIESRIKSNNHINETVKFMYFQETSIELKIFQPNDEQCRTIEFNQIIMDCGVDWVHNSMVEMMETIFS